MGAFTSKVLTVLHDKKRNAPDQQSQRSPMFIQSIEKTNNQHRRN